MKARKILKAWKPLTATTAVVISQLLPAPGYGQQSISWQAPPSIQLNREEISVTSGDALLSGTLYLPKSNHPVPVVVALHPASSPTRDAAIFSHLVETLPGLGIAVYVFDRRGSGASSGTQANGNYGLLSADAIAIRRALATDPRIDSARSGYWGLSQGGWIAMLAASEDQDAAFTISVSAPITTPDLQMNFAVENILRIRGVPDSEIAIALKARRSLDMFMRRQLDRRSTQAAIDHASDYPWFKDIYLSRQFGDPDKSGWAKEIQFNPMSIFRESKVPSLVIYGALDPWIPVAQSVAILKNSVTTGDQKIVVIAGADHSMMIDEPPSGQIDPQRFGKHSPNSLQYIATMGAWLTSSGVAKFSEK